MPQKKTAKKTARKSRGAASRAKKATPARKKVSGMAAKAKKATGQAISRAKKTAKSVAANPRRTVRKAAGKVEKTAGRAHDFGEKVAAAGMLIAGTAEVVEAIAGRAKKGTGGRDTVPRKPARGRPRTSKK